MKDYDLWTVLGGEGAMTTPEGDYPARAGSCFILQPGNYYSGSHNPVNPLSVIYIHFDYPDRPASQAFRKFPTFRRLDHLNFFALLLERVVAAYHLHVGAQDKTGIMTPDWREANHWLAAALYEVDRIDKQDRLLSGNADRFADLRALCDEIQQNPGRGWRLSSMADRLHYTKDHFIRVFRQYSGTTPREYIIRMKVEAVKMHLRHSSMSMEAIARALGYCDPAFFSRQFRQRTGLSPIHYRREAPEIPGNPGEPGRSGTRELQEAQEV